MKNDVFSDKRPRRRLTRREFHKTLAAVGLATAVVPLVPRAARAAAQATYFTWGGYDIPELFPSYIEKHGEMPNFTLFGDEEEAFQKLRAGFVADVAHPCHYNTALWRDAGLLRPIDTSRLSHWGDVFPQLKTLKGIQYGGEQYFSPFEWGNSSVTYRTDLVSDEYENNPTYGILWDERYKGRLAMFDVLEDAVPIAALYAGVDPFTMDEDDIAKVKEVLAQQRPLLRFYSPDEATIAQALASGEVVAATTWNSGVVELKKQGLPVKFMDPKEGRTTWVCGTVLLKDAPEVEKAHDVIDSLLDPRVGEFVINDYGYGHANRRSFERVSEQRLAELGLPKDPTVLLEDGVFLEQLENRAKIAQMFEEVKAGF